MVEKATQTKKLYIYFVIFSFFPFLFENIRIFIEYNFSMLHHIPWFYVGCQHFSFMFGKTMLVFCYVIMIKQPRPVCYGFNSLKLFSICECDEMILHREKKRNKHFVTDCTPKRNFHFNFALNPHRTCIQQ